MTLGRTVSNRKTTVQTCAVREASLDTTLLGAAFAAHLEGAVLHQHLADRVHRDALLHLPAAVQEHERVARRVELEHLAEQPLREEDAASSSDDRAF